jgi:hypothetical protein
MTGEGLAVTLAAGAGGADAAALGAALGSFWVAPAAPPAAAGAAAAGLAPATADGAGILTVGAAVGLGGRLMRTVSFLASGALACGLDCSSDITFNFGEIYAGKQALSMLQWFDLAMTDSVKAG